MNHKTLFLSIVAILVVISCNLSSSVEDDEDDFGETAADSSGDEFFEETDDEEFDDEPVPVIDEGDLFLRDFSFDLPLFSPDSAWNQRADDASVLGESDSQILSLYRVLLGDISSLEGYSEPVTEWPYMDVGSYVYSVPISRAGEGSQDVFICEDEGIVGWAHPKFGVETEGGPVTVPAPAGVVRPAGPENSDADAWLVLYDPDTFISWDYFAATPNRNDECLGFEGGLVGNEIL